MTATLPSCPAGLAFARRARTAADRLPVTRTRAPGRTDLPETDGLEVCAGGLSLILETEGVDALRLLLDGVQVQLATGPEEHRASPDDATVPGSR
jgi:hypothetical protein